MLLARLGSRPPCKKLTTQILFPFHSPHRLFGSKATKPRTNYVQHTQELIQKKKAHVEILLKQGVVKKATALINDTYVERDDSYTALVEDDGEREYVVLDEVKPRKQKNGDMREYEASVDGILEANKGEYSHCYADWCAHYQPLFEKSPYSLGYQEPDANGNYPWAEAVNSANQMVFGNDGFKPLQLEALNASLKGEDVFLSLPTGGGKSLCFWLRALLSPGIAIIISPLIALIHDQVQKLASRGVPVLRLDSSTRAASMKALKQDDMKCKLIYITPERMRSNEFLEVFRNLYLQDQISMVAIDEAHCISEWGHDFRPSYSVSNFPLRINLLSLIKKLGVFRKEFPNVPIMAVTATATQQVQQDILDSLHIPDATVLAASFNRPNIYYEVRSKASAVDDIAHLLSSEKYSNASGIIYCLTKSDCEELADALRARNIHASPYHSSMNASIRSQVQDAWSKGDIKVLCTTTAFGLGVDKQDIRYVIHHTLPLSLEAYYQQTGRAGRDGLDATCILYYSQSDLSRATKMLAAASSPDSDVVEDDVAPLPTGGSIGSKVDLMDNMVTFCGEQKKCRREILLAYFGEKMHRSGCNHKCDNCQRLLTPKDKAGMSTQFDFVPPPHISLLPHAQTLISIPTPARTPAATPTPTPQAAVPLQPSYMEEEDEEELRLSPLERLKRRRAQQNEWQRSKLNHPSQASIFFDKANRDRQKQVMELNRKREEMKRANEDRLEQLRDAMFKPEKSAVKATPIVKAKPEKKGVKIAPDADTKSVRHFGNSLHNPNKVKLNKTGRIEQDTDTEQPSHGILRKGFMSRNPNKLNKTGKINGKEVSEDYKGPTKSPLKRSSLRGKKEKVNKTGRVQEKDEDPTEIRTRTSLQKAKLNKTGRVHGKESQDDENDNLRDPSTSKKAAPSVTKTNGTSTSGSSGASAAPLAATKKNVPLAALQRVFNDIASEHQNSDVGEFFSEHVMLHILETKPTSLVELTTIPGVGKHNAVKFADKILPLFRTNK